jgi:hypothetical protein
MRRRGLYALLVLCVVVAELALPPVPSAAQPPTPIEPHLGYGIHIGPNTDLDYGVLNALRVDWVKLYDLGQVSGFSNKRVLFRRDVTWPDNWETFKAGTAQFVADATALGVDAIEFGNEPNLQSEWVRLPNAWEYVQVLRVAYTVTKAVNPNMIVVSAGLAPTNTLPGRNAIDDLDFAREMMENGAGKWFDAFGYHPYGYNLAPETDPFESHQLVFRRTERIRQIMEENGVFKQIWLTEFGWLRDPNEDGIGCSDGSPEFSGFAWLRVPAATQASYLVRAFEYAHENWPWAGPMFVWNLNWNMMGWLPLCDHRRWFGLLKSNGSRTPAFDAFARMPHYYSDYAPQIEIAAESMVATTSLACLKRVTLGELAVHNIGYPANVRLQVQPVNGIEPPFVEVSPSQVIVGTKVQVIVNPEGIRSAGQYPLYVNVRYSVGGQVKSQAIQGYVIVTGNLSDC